MLITDYEIGIFYEFHQHSAAIAAGIDIIIKKTSKCPLSFAKKKILYHFQHYCYVLTRYLTGPPVIK